MIVQAIFFYIFAGICVASAAMVISARNPVHSVLYLILAFVNAAGLFILMGAEFLAMILIVVYVGAVAVLFLFVVMMLDVDFAELKQGVLQYLPVGIVIGGIFLAELLLVVFAWVIGPQVPQCDHRADPAAGQSDQHGSDRSRALHPVCLLLRGCRPRPLGGHGRRHRPDLAAQGARAPAGYRRAGWAHAGDRDRNPPCASGAGLGGRGMSIGLGHYLSVAAILFTFGVFGIFLNRKNVIIILMSIELILLAVNINLVAFSTHLGDIVGQIFTLIVLTVAAAEAAIGLAILVVYYRNRGSIAVEDINLMKG